MSTILLVVLLLVLFGGLGGWGYSSGYYSANAFGGGLGLVLLIVIVLALMGRL